MQIKICIISTIRNAHTVRWGRILAVRGHDVVVVSSEPNEWGIKGLDIIECLSVKSESYLGNVFLQLKRAFKIHRLVRIIKPDIIHIHSLDYVHPLFWAIATCRQKIFSNLIVSVWGSDVLGNIDSPQSRRGVWAKKILLNQAREITATTQFLATATERIIDSKRTVHIVPFGIDCHMFKRKKERTVTTTIKIGFIKHLIAKYGPDCLLKAMKIVLEHVADVHLTMVGHGPMEFLLKRMVTDMGIEKNISFTGYIQNEDLPELLERMDIVVMPSVHESETFGVAAVEAQAMGIPVIASNIGGVSEAILDGETGILVEPGSPEALAKAIIKLIVNPDLRRTMGEAGRRFVLERFDIERNVTAFEELYKKVMDQGIR